MASKRKIVSIAVNTPLNQEGIHPLYILGRPVFEDGPVVLDISYRRDAGQDIGIKHDSAYVVQFEDSAIEHAIAAKYVITVGSYDEAAAQKIAEKQAAAGIPKGDDDA